MHFKLAYSGGVDSHVLLHSLCSLRSEYQFTLSAIYIDHNLHPDSANWGRYCENTCLALNVPIIIERICVSGIAEEGMEAAARRARYAAFSAAMKPGEVLLTAHHNDDQAETVLLQLLRGTGVAGLAGMPMQSDLGPGRIVRPLLGFSRAALVAYAQKHQLAWIEDPSNRQSHVRRNYLRSEIMPRLAQQWPAHADLLARTARHAAEAMVLLDEVADRDLAACRHAETQLPQTLSVTSLLSLSEPRQRNLLRYWLRHQGFLPPAESHLEEVLARVRTTPRSQQARVSWRGVEVWRYRDLLVAMPGQPDPDPSLDIAWDLRESLMLPGIGWLHAMPTTGKGLSRFRLQDNRVHVRLRSGGELLLLEGRKHHHALKKLLQAEGVPPWLRKRLPLLFSGNALAAVADRWVCAPYLAGQGEAGVNIVWEPALSAANVPVKAR